jgi:hypothetical protein
MSFTKADPAPTLPPKSPKKNCGPMLVPISIFLSQLLFVGCENASIEKKQAEVIVRAFNK